MMPEVAVCPSHPCTHMYVCMYMCTYVCMYICAHPPYTCTHVYTLKYLSVLNDRDLCCPNWLFHEPQVMGFTWLINMWMCVHLCVRVDIRGQLAGPVFFLREGSRLVAGSFFHRVTSKALRWLVLNFGFGPGTWPPLRRSVSVDLVVCVCCFWNSF